jgi:hypothetical protein
MELYKFKDQVDKRGKDYTKPPYRIPADKMDENFAKVAPADTDGEPPAYKIDSTDEGWVLVPQAAFDVCENGQPARWLFCAQREIVDG